MSPKTCGGGWLRQRYWRSDAGTTSKRCQLTQARWINKHGSWRELQQTSIALRGRWQKKGLCATSGHMHRYWVSCMANQERASLPTSMRHLDHVFRINTLGLHW
jgi:hypothetical protein